MSLSVKQQQEIDEQQEEIKKTKRSTVSALDEVLYKPFNVLDHGFVRVIDYMGDDNAIVQAARVSYGKGTKKINEDKGLINYLMRHRHSTPFEMCEVKFHIKMPIFVARQWVRHRTANINEYSARYSILDNEFYVPKPENLATQSSINNQGRGDVIGEELANNMISKIKDVSSQCYNQYEYFLNENNQDPNRPGLARELARMQLPVNFYTQWYWKIDLHNLMHFLSLRGDPHAQYEIRVYAQKMLNILKLWVPTTYEAFMKHRVNSANLSSKALDVVRKMIKGTPVDQETSDLSPREWKELMDVLGK